MEYSIAAGCGMGAGGFAMRCSLPLPLPLSLSLSLGLVLLLLDNGEPALHLVAHVHTPRRSCHVDIQHVVL